MEAKFIGHCTQTEQNLREMQFAALGKLRLCIYSAAIIFVALTSALLFANGTSDTAVLLAAMCVILLLVGFVRPILAARQQFKRNEIITENNPLSPTELRFYDDHVATSNPITEKQQNFKYSQFKKLKKTKHLYLLKLPQQLYLMIERKSFTEGTPKEFEAFIKEKIKK